MYRGARMVCGITRDGSDQAMDVVEAVGYVCLACLCAAAGFTLALDTAGTFTSRASFEIADTINPNDASPASLARLPNIGPSRAREIISYRTRISGRTGHRPPFRRAEDLREVTGIGPATIEAIRPYLSFGLQSADQPDPTGRQPSVVVRPR